MELWNEPPDELALWVILLGESNRRVDPEIGGEESRGREPHPISVVQTPV